MNTLDYFQQSGPERKATATPWLRVFVSHRARLRLARTASVGQGFVLLAVLSLLAGVLSTAPTRLHAVLARVLESQNSNPPVSVLPPGQVMLEGTLSAGKTTLLLTPLYFAGLCAVLTLAASVWTKCTGGRSWSRCFPAIVVGVTPLAWFFALIQLEGLAPLLPGTTGTAWWNPLTNYLHFGVLMTGVPLLGAWAVDASRIYNGLEAGEALGTVEAKRERVGVAAGV